VRPNYIQNVLGNGICIIDFNPVSVGVLKVQLFDAIFSDVVLVRGTGPIAKADV
jgi:hypothetical protein